MSLEFTPRMNFCMITILILWGVGAYIVCVDLISVPRRTHEWYAQNPDWFAGKPEFPQPERFWEWNMGNGFVSNIEHIVMIVFLFFGFMRFIDLMKLFHEAEKDQAWRMFWEICENNEC